MAYDTDSLENPHADLLRSESFVSDGEREWLRWVAKVEKLLGHSLDGDQDRDGYSLDFAYDFQCSGDTPEFYVAEVRAEQARIAAEKAAAA